MTKLNIKDIQQLFPKRVSVLTFYLKGDASEINEGNELLEKWRGHYKIVGESGCEDAYHDYNILCTEQAYKDFSKIECWDDWAKKSVLEYPYTQEMYEEVNSDGRNEDGDEVEEYQPIKLKKPFLKG